MSRLLLLILFSSTALGGVEHQGIPSLWHPQAFEFVGATAHEAGTSPNPWLDYRGDMVFTNPGATRTVKVPAFFAGDGRTSPDSEGNVWRVRWNPAEVGTWSYVVNFRGGPELAVETDASSGFPVLGSDDGATGTIDIGVGFNSAPGFLAKGRLQYVGEHYLQHANGERWIKVGTDSPEDFLGYHEFDGTVDQGGTDWGLTNGLHRYDQDWDGSGENHTGDWSLGDPYWGDPADKKGQGIIGALNYLSAQGVNSIYLLTMNLGGDGQNVYPFIDGGVPDDVREVHYDISKLAQWWIVLNHAQELGIQAHFVLSETEDLNEHHLDDGAFGTERKLFLREMIARFSCLNAVKWNLGEELDEWSATERTGMFAYFQELDPYDHPIGFHTRPQVRLPYPRYEEHLGEAAEMTIISIQGDENDAGEHMRYWREMSAASGHKWVLEFDEDASPIEGLSAHNDVAKRKRILWDVLINGGGVEHYFGGYALPSEGGDLSVEDFRTRENMWKWDRHALAFMRNRLFWRYSPDPTLVTGESPSHGGGECTYDAAHEKYMIYLPDAGSGCTLEVRHPDREFRVEWYNPRAGTIDAVDLYTSTTVAPFQITIGLAPTDVDDDWALYVEEAE